MPVAGHGGCDMPPSLMKKRLQDLLMEYGAIALVIHLSIFAMVLAGFTIAITAGVEVESTAGTAGTVGAAYLATQLVKPIRIGITIVLTPIVGGLLGRFRRKPANETPQQP
jgi:hypothetical protein